MKVFKNDQWQMILQIALAVLLFRFVLYQNLVSPLGLTHFYFFLFFIAAGIIIIAGLYLYRIVLQEENPHKKIVKNPEKAYYLYLALNIVGIGISFFVSSAINKTYYFGFFLGLAAILYLYVTQWRKIIVFDNIVFALIITFPVFLEVFTDLLPALNTGDEMKNLNARLLSISFQLVILLWLLYFIKTIVLDLKFMQLDIRRNKKTLATLHGREVGAKRTTYLSLLPLLLILSFMVYHAAEFNLLVIYVAVAVVLPFIWYLVKLWNAKEAKDFNVVNNILSGIIWLTIFSVVILYLNFQ